MTNCRLSALESDSGDEDSDEENFTAIADGMDAQSQESDAAEATVEVILSSDRRSYRWSMYARSVLTVLLP